MNGGFKRWYVQCVLYNGSRAQQAWIPERFAQVGKNVELKNEHGDWEDGWTVTRPGVRQPASFVEARCHDSHRMRQATDV